MAKTIIRETIIILLLCLAIILVLGVVLYNYVPTNKIVPSEVSYTQTEEVNKAIKESVSADNTQVILSYEIDETDLDNYEKNRAYQPGKTNPFSSIKEDTDSGESSNSESNNSGSSNSGNSDKQNSSTKDNTENTNDNNSKEDKSNENGTLFPDKGTK